MKNIKTYAIFVLLILVIGFLTWDGCQSRKQAKDFEKQMAEYNVKEQGFIVTIDRQGKKITRQNQIILTKKQAIQQGLIKYTKLKKVKSQVRIITKTKIEKEFIPFVDDDIFDDVEDRVVGVDTSGVISVPKSFSKFNEWYWIGGKIVKRGIELDSIQFFNKQTITIGEKKLKGLKNIFKKKIPTVEIINESPYVSVQGLQNVVIKRNPPKWWNTTVAKIGFGVVIGSYITIQAGKATN